MPAKVYVLNGPNLNLLGMREPEIYGADTLDDIAGRLEDRGRELGLEIEMRQSNWLKEAPSGETAISVVVPPPFFHGMTLQSAARMMRMEQSFEFKRSPLSFRGSAQAENPE